MPRPRVPFILSALALSAAVVSLLRAGDINPPPGAVGPTMKPLTDIEPRIAVNTTNTPGTTTGLFRITQPGSYYLTGNFTGVAAKAGIEIAASDVTLDLAGFRLQGIAGTLAGINVIGTQSNISIRNGTIRGWAGGGIAATTGLECDIESVRAIGNTGNGIALGSGGTIRTCRCDSNTQAGISTSTDTLVQNCTSRLNSGAGIAANDHSIISDTLSRGNTGAGLSLGAGNLVANDVVAQNGIGISAGSGLNAVNTIARNNSGHGFFCFGGAYTSCVSTTNTGAGFNTDSAIITACRSTANGGEGITAGNASLISNSITLGNDLFGIHAAIGGLALNDLCVNDCAANSGSIFEIKFDGRGWARGNYLQSANANCWGVAGTTNSTLMTDNCLSGGFVPTFGGYQGPDVSSANIGSTCNPSSNYDSQ